MVYRAGTRCGCEIIMSSNLSFDVEIIKRNKVLFSSHMSTGMMMIMGRRRCNSTKLQNLTFYCRQNYELFIEQPLDIFISQNTYTSYLGNAI